MKSIWMAALAAACLSLVSCSNTVEGAKEDIKENTPTKQEVGNVTAAAELTPAVKAAIVASPILNDSANQIDVDSNATTVTLSGTVKTADMKTEAGKVAQTILDKMKATQKLENNLQVGPKT